MTRIYGIWLSLAVWLYQIESYYTNTRQFLAAISNFYYILWLMNCTVLNSMYFSMSGAEGDSESGFGLTPSVLEPDSIETARSQTVLQELKETKNSETVGDDIMDWALNLLEVSCWARIGLEKVESSRPTLECFYDELVDFESNISPVETEFSIC